MLAKSHDGKCDGNNTADLVVYLTLSLPCVCSGLGTTGGGGSGSSNGDGDRIWARAPLPIGWGCPSRLFLHAAVLCMQKRKSNATVIRISKLNGRVSRPTKLHILSIDVYLPAL